MFISDFNYDLPDALIAQYPTQERRASRLLELGDSLSDKHFSDLPHLLNPGDLLVFNDTRVIPARLRAHKDSGGKAEILIERLQNERDVLAHIRASKSPKPGTTMLLRDGVTAKVVGRDGELFALVFSSDVMPFLEEYG